MELFVKIVNGFSFLTIFAKSSIMDVWQDSEFASEASNDLRKWLHLRCMTGFWTHLSINYFQKTIACSMAIEKGETEGPLAPHQILEQNFFPH